MQFERKSVVDILAGIRGLNHLSRLQLEELTKSGVVNWGPDEFILQEGRGDSDHMVVILSGIVYVRKSVKTKGVESYEQIAEILAPNIVGENSFFTGLERSASIYAKEKVSGIIVTREDLVRLIRMDKSSVKSFMSQIAWENLSRVESSATLYFTTLRLAQINASIINTPIHQKLVDIRMKLETGDCGIQELRDLVGETSMLIRQLNGNLNQLYTFSNLVPVKIESIDPAAFALPETHKNYKTLKAVTDELHMAHDIIPLDMINYKEIILNAVTPERGNEPSSVDYPNVISRAIETYQAFAKYHAELGVNLRLPPD
ncbi:hypothetical protein MNBD_NITROSPINAE04-2400 [hydrothermal vent metagenome]|uniref:Cyclic nucleotide-binding domain-containing protein n=1 Tax=hydrothermal vent metagenome TaxID=652676 RepID=A0A3B1C7E8_9ZZZZ